MTSDDPKLEALVQEHLERCQFTLTQQEALCDGDDSDCENETISEGESNDHIMRPPALAYHLNTKIYL